MNKKNKKNVSTFKMYNYVDGTEIGMPLNGVQEKAKRLYDQILFKNVFDKKEIKNFLLEVYCCGGC